MVLDTIGTIVELRKHFYTIPAKLAQTTVALLAIIYVFLYPDGNLRDYSIYYIGFTLVTAIISLYKESTKREGFPVCLKCHKPLLQLVGAEYSCKECGTKQKYPS